MSKVSFLGSVVLRRTSKWGDVEAMLRHLGFQQEGFVIANGDYVYAEGYFEVGEGTDADLLCGGAHGPESSYLWTDERASQWITRDELLAIGFEPCVYDFLATTFEVRRVDELRIFEKERIAGDTKYLWGEDSGVVIELGDGEVIVYEDAFVGRETIT